MVVRGVRPVGAAGRGRPITGDHGAPVAAIRLTMNALSSVGGGVTATIRRGSDRS
jgi:hypothetical protein